jgi:hypothetical protein
MFPVLGFIFQQGTAPGVELRAFADFVTVARHDVLALLAAVQRGGASVLECWQGAVDSRAYPDVPRLIKEGCGAP